MNDISFDSAEQGSIFGSGNNWKLLVKNPEFIGIFDWNEHKITETKIDDTVAIYAKIEDIAGNILSANTTGIDENNDIAVVPAGFKVSEEEGENTISTGLVIQDSSDNEFVWIPVIGDIDNSPDDYNEPTALTDTVNNNAYDSQEALNHLYGANYYNYETDFNYTQDYTEMVTSVNANDGFYIGRYETTIDSSNNIGSKYNETVLTANTNNSQSFYYRWYGLYAEQKHANILGNGTNVQTIMMYGILYDKAMEYIEAQNAAGKTNYQVNEVKNEWHPGSGGAVVKTGQSNPGTTGDVALNIWDLESNAWEWTAEANSTYGRVVRGRFLQLHLFSVLPHRQPRLRSNQLLYIHSVLA